MSEKLDQMYPISGRHLKEDGETVNLADIMSDVYDEASGALKVKADLEVSDIQIGVVEIKDSSSDVRAEVGPNGLHVSVKNRTKNIVFHNASSNTGDGEAQEVEDYTKLKVEIYGSELNTERTIKFYEKMSNSTKVPLTGVKRNGLSVSESTTGLNEVWEFSVTGAHEIVMELYTITGGTVTINGTLVA